jgi:putative transposase
LEQLARFLERDYESAATNPIETPRSGVARRTAKGKYWRDPGMVERWVASAWLLTENRFRKISGHRDLRALATILGRKTETEIL